MAIRFLCAGCSQPIEVDDQWASKAVACPYCRRTITAPAESSITDLAAIPVAAPLGPAPNFDPLSVTSSVEARVLAPVHPNRVAAAAFALAISAVALIIVAWIILEPHRLELEEQFRKAMADSRSVMQGSIKLLEAYNGKLPAWFIAAELLYLSSMALSVAALVCGIIGVRRSRNRGMAAAGIAISGGLFLFICAGAALA